MGSWGSGLEQTLCFSRIPHFSLWAGCARSLWLRRWTALPVWYRSQQISIFERGGVMSLKLVSASQNSVGWYAT